MSLSSIKNNTRERGRAIIVVALLSFIVAVPLHELYDFSGQPFFVSFFAPVNESVWEHTKLAFYPLVVFMLWPITKYQKKLSFNQRIANASVSSFISIFFMVVVYYGARCGFSFSSLFFDISLLLVADIVGCIHAFSCENNVQNGIFKTISTIYLVFMPFIFLLFSYYPPDIPLFYSV